MTDAGVRRHSFEVEADSNVRLDALLAEQMSVSRTQAATLIATGNVRINDMAEKASYKPRAGDRIVVQLPPPPAHPLTPESIPLDVVYEDDALLVVDKAAGMVVHPAPGNWSGTLVNALLGRGGDLAPGSAEVRPGLVHRLDKDTSGLLLVAKTERAHRLLSAAIAARRVERRYAALCWGHLDQDAVTVERPIGRDPRDRKRMAIVNSGRSAKTAFQRLGRFETGDLLRAQLFTGRTHQIRVHLASLGHPVMGDDVYGGGGGRRTVGLPKRRQFLHAAWLVFRHPVTGAQMDLRSPLPADLRHALATVAESPDLSLHPDPLDSLGFYALDS